MVWFLTWLIAVELLGLSALPVAVRLLRPLSDRGYLFAKPLGVLVVAYLGWILGSLGVLHFQQATIALIAAAVGVAGWGAWGRETLAQLRQARLSVWVSEAVFLLGFAGAAWIRAHNPEISGTEKPMDFALLNALYRTDGFPAEDPWMSGFSISYYYFGYLLLATVAKLSGVPAAVGYNLGVALVFALVVAGSFSLAYSLLSRLLPQLRPFGRLLAALVAPTMIGIMGNLEGLLEVLAARGFGDASFWKWIGVKGLEAAAQPQGWLPTSFWWWWRASRVIPTIKPDGIDEFPYFSFLLGDLHPHYTALPWGLLVLALSLSALLGRQREDASSLDQPPFARWLGVLVPALALGFLLVGNSWDFPTYTALFWACSLVPLVASDGSRQKLLRRVALLVLISALSILIYSPFFLGFSSQTKGIGLSADKTPLPSMLILFGPFLLVLCCFLLWRLWHWIRPRRGGAKHDPIEGRPASRVGRWARGSRAASVPVVLVSAGGIALLLASAVAGSTTLLLGLLLLTGSAAASLLSPRDPEEKADPGAQRFLLTLTAAGLLLLLGPEMLFLVDLFGTRMNTVFKFHYQAWLLLGLASGVAVVWMAAAMKSRALGRLVAAAAALLVVAGLVYPLAATPAKIQGSQPPATLDGAAFYQKIRPDDYAAIQWLSRAAVGRPVVLEATGGEYSEYARVSTFSGLPSVLGWAGHEVQWRGRGEEPQRRTQDVDAIYGTADPSTMRALLSKYGVRYVFVGSLEVEKYGPGVYNRFEGQLEVAHRQGKVVIYRVAGAAQQEAPMAAPNG